MYNTAAGTAKGCIAFSSRKLIDLGSGELPGGHTVFKQDVKLAVCASLGLRQAEEGLGIISAAPISKIYQLTQVMPMTEVPNHK